MNNDVTTREMNPVALGNDPAFNWGLRQLLAGQTADRQRELLAEALRAVVAATGDAGLGALLLFAATVGEVGAGEGGR